MSQVEYDVDQGSEEENDEPQYVAVEDEALQEEEVDSNDNDEEEDEGETRLGGGRDEDDEDADASRRARRAENKSRRQRQRDARQRTERELNFLRSRNEDLERRFSRMEQNVDARVTNNELVGLEGQINKAKSDLQLANQVIASAADNHDGKNLAEALDHRDAIRDNLRGLQESKEYLTEERSDPQVQPEQLDPRHVAHAQQFMRENDWWDPSGRDQDSQTVLLIDRALVQEGYDPRSREYWDELRTRTEEALPDHFETQRDQGNDDGNTGEADTGRAPRGRRQKGPQFRTGGRERPLKKNEVYISAERRSAMEEAGVWDDPVLRNKYLKAYADYDRNEDEGA